MRLAKHIAGYITFILLTAGLFLLVYNFDKVKLIFTHAGINTTPDIFIYFNQKAKSTNKFWKSLAQGGEDNKPMLTPVLGQLQTYRPEYIRLDHIFDHYQTVSYNSKTKQIKLHWLLLDQAVDEILSVGATPVLALSYYPSSLTIDGQTTSSLKNPADWQYLVNQTIKHFSGKRGIDNVIYEVWNEPNLFGKFTIGGKKDYRLLYDQTIKALPDGPQIKPFMIGGPSISYADYKGISRFLAYVKKNNLRLDFVSFHIYQDSSKKTAYEITKVKRIIAKYKMNLPVYITEWGINGDLDPRYDDLYGYNHAIKVITGLDDIMGLKDKLFAFEIVDGRPPPKYKSGLWGRWGLFTHPSTSLRPKPRWRAFEKLNNLPWNLSFTPNTDWPIKALVNFNQNKTKTAIILTNHSQKTIYAKLHLRFMPNGLWRLVDLYTSQKIEKVKVINNNSLDKNITLLAGSAVIVNLERLDNLVRSSGRLGYTNDYALNLIDGWELLLPNPNKTDFKLNFWFKYKNLPQNQEKLLDIKVVTNQRPAGVNLAELSWQYRNFNLSLSLKNGNRLSRASIPKEYFKTNKWYLAQISLSKAGLNDLIVIKIDDYQLKLPIIKLSSPESTWSLNFNQNHNLNIDDVAVVTREINWPAYANDPKSIISSGLVNLTNFDVNLAED